MYILLKSIVPLCKFKMADNIIIRLCDLDSKEHVHTRVKVKVSDYLFTFTGLRSKCPGSAGVDKRN